MHTLVSRLILIALIFCSSSRLLAHVELDYPQGGETFITGQTILIQWHIAVPHETLNWDLHFSADGGMNWKVIQLNIPVGQLSYEWEVPDTMTVLGKIRVFMNNVDQDYLDISGNFTIVPNTMPPILDAPAQDIVIECNPASQMEAIQTWLNNHGGASVTNFCDGLAWTHDFLGLIDGCGATGNEEVTFTAMDECGFVITTASLIISDTSPPVISTPAFDKTVECNGIGNTTELNLWLDNRGGALGSDECGNVTWSNNFTNLSDGCGMTGSATVTFSATDDCGNTSTTAATFTIEDTTDPQLTPAVDRTQECNDPYHLSDLEDWLGHLGYANPIEFCGPITWGNNFQGLSDDCGASGSATVIFTITDACGNSTTRSAVYTIEDNAAPIIDIPARDTTIICGPDQQQAIDTWLANNGGARGHDKCGSVSWSNDYSSIPDTCNLQNLITFSLQDECGNTNTTSALLRLVDTITHIPVGFLDSTYVWTEMVWNATGLISTSKFTMDSKPSVLAGIPYYELLRVDEENSEDWYGTNNYLREENNIVYQYFTPHEAELYNFNLNVGDTFFTEIDIPLIVDSIGVFELLNGELRKEMKLRCIDDEPGTDYYRVWVEGIGNINGLFDHSDACQVDGFSYAILCMHRNDTLIYDRPDIDGCWRLPVATNDPIQGSISVYPNPANDVITIDAGLIKSFPIQLSLLDLQGRVVMRNELAQQVSSVAVDQIIPGMYLIRLASGDEIYFTKVVIE